MPALFSSALFGAAMHRGMWSSYLHELSPEEAIREFARKGWRHLELSTEHGAALLERGEPAQVGEQFRRFCDHLEVELPQGHLRLRADIALPDRDSRRREIDDLKRWIELFASLGIQAGVLHPGGQSRHDPTRTPDEVFRIVAESLTELVAHARGTPTVICLENGANAGRLLRLIGAVGGEGLAICLDTSHLGLARARSLEAAQTDYEFIREAGAYLKALHLSDNDGSGDQHLLPFEGGTVDWEGVMRGLREVGYAGLFNFEIPGEMQRPLPERLEELDRITALADRMMETIG